jgi:uncharacterized protein (TIGR02646 family)
VRSLSKLPAPEYLNLNAARLTAIYREKALAGLPSAPWQDDDIRDRLFDETEGRCAYCDSSIRAVAYDHIEHILPKSKHPDEVLEWANLTIACPRCNINKGDYCSHEVPIINPYSDDPEAHLIFLGPLVLAQPGDDRASTTVHRLKLSRAELAEARVRRLQYFESMIDRWTPATTPEIKDVLEEFIRDELTSGEYRSTVKAYLRLVGFPGYEAKSAA